MSAPKLEKVRARDVVPYEWGLWCTVGDCKEPGVNTIEGVSWSEDGQKLWFLLSTHNFYSAAPDEEVELVRQTPTAPDAFMATVRARHAATIAARPVPTKPCVACAGTGKIGVMS